MPDDGVAAMSSGCAAQEEASFDPVAWWARVEGSRTALIEATTGARHSYAELDAEADRWSVRLRGAGVQVGDRVGVLAQNRVEFIPLLFACIRVGAVLVPLNWRLSAPELTRVLRNSEPRLLLGEERFRSTATTALAGFEAGAAVRWIDLDGSECTRATAIEGAATMRHPSRADDVVMLLYTSGSTGVPKGVMIPHRQLVANAIATTTAWQLGADDIGPAATPFFHTGGWNVFTTPLLYCGGAIVLIDGFNADEYLDLLDRFDVTVTFGVPTQLAMLRSSARWGRPLPKLRWFISGGAPCPQRLKGEVRAAGYVMREGYGLTECGPNCFAISADAALARPGSVGWPVPQLQMRLRGDDGALCAEAGAAAGELELRGPQLFTGYFHAPDATASVMTDDGWLRTGDLARRDADGCYSISGRRKEMFISGGENVFPGEVEAALLDCDGVADACVIGVPDERWGEVGCAMVVRSAATATEAAILAALRTRLAAYKIPKRVCFVDALPRLGSGKIDRTAVVRLVTAGGGEVAAIGREVAP